MNTSCGARSLQPHAPGGLPALGFVAVALLQAGATPALAQQSQLSQFSVVVEGDSLSSYNYGFQIPPWSCFLTGFDRVINNAAGGSAVVDFPGCGRPISLAYGTEDLPFAPIYTHEPTFFVLNGAHNDLYLSRHSVDETWAGVVNLMEQARADGFIVIGCTLSRSQLLIDSGNESDRLAFNSLMRSASWLWDGLMDWDHILPQDTGDMNAYVDGTHPGLDGVEELAAGFEGLATRIASVPEPSPLALGALALVCIVAFAYRIPVICPPKSSDTTSSPRSAAIRLPSRPFACGCRRCPSR